MNIRTFLATRLLARAAMSNGRAASRFRAVTHSFSGSGQRAHHAARAAKEVRSPACAY
jgi:hypothetical protein